MGLSHGLLSKARENQGQATIELAALIPCVLIIALISVNGLGFISKCASFDRLARQTITTYAAAPQSGVDSSAAAQAIQRELAQRFSDDALSVSVQVEARALGLYCYRAELAWQPTLFGWGFRDSIFGVSLPPLTHQTELVVDPYKPGVFF